MNEFDMKTVAWSVTESYVFYPQSGIPYRSNSALVDFLGFQLIYVSAGYQSAHTWYLFLELLNEFLQNNSTSNVET